MILQYLIMPLIRDYIYYVAEFYSGLMAIFIISFLRPSRNYDMSE